MMPDQGAAGDILTNGSENGQPKKRSFASKMNQMRSYKDYKPDELLGPGKPLPAFFRTAQRTNAAAAANASLHEEKTQQEKDAEALEALDDIVVHEGVPNNTADTFKSIIETQDTIIHPSPTKQLTSEESPAASPAKPTLLDQYRSVIGSRRRTGGRAKTVSFSPSNDSLPFSSEESPADVGELVTSRKRIGQLESEILTILKEKEIAKRASDAIISETATKMVTLEIELSELRDKISSQSKEIEQLKKGKGSGIFSKSSSNEVDVLKQRVKTLESELQTIAKQKSELQIELDKIKKEPNNYKEENETLRRRINDLEEKISDIAISKGLIELDPITQNTNDAYLLKQEILDLKRQVEAESKAGQLLKQCIKDRDTEIETLRRQVPVKKFQRLFVVQLSLWAVVMSFLFFLYFYGHIDNRFFSKLRN